MASEGGASVCPWFLSEDEPAGRELEGAPLLRVGSWSLRPGPPTGGARCT